MAVPEYDKARERGEKHTASMKEAVDYVRQHEPKMPISITTVRRILAEFRPKFGELALIANVSILNSDELARHQSLRAQAPGYGGTDITTDFDRSKSAEPRRSFKFGFIERPNYPRHNAKTPNA
jgi:hypothetical protein